MVKQTVNVGDWNGDGSDDVGLIIYTSTPSGSSAGRVEVYTGSVGGTPAWSVTGSVGKNPVTLVGGDFTGDGTPNLAVGWDRFRTTNSLALTALPDPIFSVYSPGSTSPVYDVDDTRSLRNVTYPAGSDFGSGASGLFNLTDLDGDGADDLAISFAEAFDESNGGRLRPPVFVFSGRSSLAQSTHTYLLTDEAAENDYPGTDVQTVSDFNGDGLSDVVVAFPFRSSVYDDEPRVNVYFGQSDAPPSANPGFTIQFPAAAGTLSQLSNSVATGDFDGDGYSDLAVVLFLRLDEPSRIDVYYGGPDSDSAADVSIEVDDDVLAKPGTMSSLIFGQLTTVPDLNQDGTDELLLTTIASANTNALLYEGGTFAPRTLLQAPNPRTHLGASIRSDVEHEYHSAVGDFDNDGVASVLLPQDRDRNYKDAPFYAYRLGASVLPVELSRFDATLSDETVRLTWTTTSETNNAGFSVERRVGDASTWSTLGFIDGAGTTPESTAYSFDDGTLPFDATSASYRLRQVDLDGSATLSDVVTVRRPDPVAARLRAPFPNPARGTATLQYETSVSGPVRIEAFNLLGQRVAVLVDDVRKVGPHEFQADVSRWASGTYFLRLTTASGRQTQPIVVVR